MQDAERKEYAERAKHIQEEKMVAWRETMKSLPQNYESQQKKSLPKKKTSRGGLSSRIQVGPKAGGGGGRAVKTGPVINAVNSLAAQNPAFLLPKVKFRNLSYSPIIGLHYPIDFYSH